MLPAPQRPISLLPLLSPFHHILLSLVVVLGIAILFHLVGNSCLLHGSAKRALVARHRQIVEMLAFRLVEVRIEKGGQTAGSRARFGIVAAFGRVGSGGSIAGNNGCVGALAGCLGVLVAWELVLVSGGYLGHFALVEVEVQSYSAEGCKGKNSDR